jgi:hypothetical protein
VYPISSKGAIPIIRSLVNLTNEIGPEKTFYFNGDGDDTFNRVRKWFDGKEEIRSISRLRGNYKTRFFLKPTGKELGKNFTNSNRQVDSAIRTIRNLIGRVSQYNPEAFANADLMEKMVEIYNNTVHSAFANHYTPAEVQEDFRLEAQYIRECEEQVERIDKFRLLSGFMSYEPGNILLVHLDLGKTGLDMQKRRRNFDELATFVKYEGGNVVCDLFLPYQKFNRVVVPIYYTKKLAKDLDDYKNKYYDMFITTELIGSSAV